MKRKIMTVLMITTMIATIPACGGSSDATSVEHTYEADTPEGVIESAIIDRVTSEYDKTTVDLIDINPDAGTEDVDDDYVALVHLVWNVKNPVDTTNEMLSMYSSDLAATIANECSNVQEIAIFWEVPYLEKNSKYSYEKSNGAMYLTDSVPVY